MDITPSLALWDDNRKRAAVLKEQLDMFASEDKETALLPVMLKPPVEHHDVVFLSFDECGEPVLSAARAVRVSSDLSYLMLIGGKNCDFSPCFRPKIRPSGILFRPVQTHMLRELLEEVTDEMSRLAQSESDDVFIIKSEGVTYRILYKNILFFEAGNKLVTMHTAGQAIHYYDSMDNLTVVLPTYFIRCHRGYIVNTRKIEEMRTAEMELRLAGGYRVPFSRSRRSEISQVLSGRPQVLAE